MGLWIKCPGCQGKNPLFASICDKCGQSLINLTREQRVYIIDTGEAAPVSAPPPAAAPAAVLPEIREAPPPPAPKAEKKPKRPRKKKG